MFLYVHTNFQMSYVTVRAFLLNWSNVYLQFKVISYNIKAFTHNLKLTKYNLKYSLTFKSDHLSFHTQVYKRITKKYT